MDLPDGPHTPPETQKDFEDLKGLSMTQHLQGFGILNEENSMIKNSQATYDATEDSHAGKLEKEKVEPPQELHKQEATAHNLTRQAISPSSSHGAVFAHERTSSSQRKGVGSSEKNHRMGVPVQAWGNTASGQAEEPHEEQIKRNFVSIAKPSTACTNQLLGAYMKETRYQHIYPNYMSTIIPGNPAKPSCENNRPIRVQNIVASSNERPVTVATNKVVEVNQPPKTAAHGVQLFAKWYL